MRILVIGCGSIGKRHITNLRKLGVKDILVVDLRRDRLAEVKEMVPEENHFTDLAKALTPKADGAIVGVSTAAHVPVALEVARAGIPIMMEKPLSHTLEGLDELDREMAAKKVWMMVAYSLRYHPCILKIRDLLDRDVIGRPLSVRAECGQYLPDWHPWEDYRDWYMSKEEEGGGALLDISHEIDYLRSFFGDVRAVTGLVTHVSDLDITTDDLTELVLEFDGGVVGNVHLDLLQRTYRRNCLIVGSDGTIDWDYVRGSVRWFVAGAQDWMEEHCVSDRNSYFLDELRHFLACIEGRSTPVVDLTDARCTLEVVLAAKRASRERTWIDLRPAV